MPEGDLEQNEERQDAEAPVELEVDVDGLQAQLQKATQERDQLQDQLLRTMADFQNARKRAQQELENQRTYATEKLVSQLLPVLDNFERTVEALEGGSSAESLMNGIKAVDRQFRQVLESVNVTRIKAHGEPFDPDLHEAIAAEPSEEHPENTIVGEVEAGYRMADKVIRPARVRVSRKP